VQNVQNANASQIAQFAQMVLYKGSAPLLVTESGSRPWLLECHFEEVVVQCWTEIVQGVDLTLGVSEICDHLESECCLLTNEFD
jgi:hypothetical protein